MAQVLVTDLEVPVPTADDERHLAKVLRVRPGEVVIAVDGAGRWRPCAWTADASMEPTGETVTEQRPRPAITVAFSLLKGDRNESVVQKLTELGVDRIVPLVADRTVVRWDDDKATRNRERFSRVAYEAAMQSRRLWLPEVAPVVPLAALSADGVVLAHPGGGPPSLQRPAVAVGPEGGWSEAEVAGSAGTVDLGPTVLRADTAATTIGGLLCALRAKVLDLPHSVLVDR